MFGDHPYSLVAPTPESIDRSTRQHFVEFHKSKFHPNNTVLIIVGNVKFDDVIRGLERLFSGWQKGEPLSSDFPSPPVRKTGRRIW